MMKRILITGGAGFVGSSLAKLYRQKYADLEIHVLDNLKRRGSELNIPVLKNLGVHFHHGDIRNPNDFLSLPQNIDLFIEASAEPSVLTGMQGDSPLYAIESNLFGTVHALEFARKNCGMMIFLSTSRVYSIPELQNIKLQKKGDRFVVEELSKQKGLVSGGINEDFSTSGFRSIYGSTKLASEMLIEEYVHAYGLNAVINRCGVIAGPGQFGKVDQGVFTLWVARHHFGLPLTYTGFGGEGLQVRDLMHPKDLFDGIEIETNRISKISGSIFNLGGGLEVSTSLKELTKHCEKATGKTVPISSITETNPVDVPYYVTDFTKAKETLGWTPKIKVSEIIGSIAAWLKENERELKPLFVEGKK